VVGETKACALCGLQISGRPAVQTIGGREKAFCCQGCARVYQLAHQTGTLEKVLARYGAPPAAAPQATPAGQVAAFRVQGLHCANCVRSVVQSLQAQPGILAARVDLASGEGELRYDPAQADPAAALRCLDELGYHATMR
jgi:P-type Cu2+ transporter